MTELLDELAGGDPHHVSDPDMVPIDSWSDEHSAALDWMIAHDISNPIRSPFIDWSTFWQQDHKEADWLYPDVLARGRGHAIYAGHKTGKSLLMVSIMAKLATGKDPVAVVYLDYEMSEADLYERLDEMGYGPHTDLSRLYYALLPSLPPLDTMEGADALGALLDAVAEARPGHHIAVIIDTTSRAVKGDENSADTIRAFYRWTGISLKQRGTTWARLDHAGKDTERGQRGSSAKGDDVDVISRLVRTEGGLSLQTDSARMAWVPKRVDFHQATNPLRFVRVNNEPPAGTYDLAALLDSLGIAIDLGARKVVEALTAAGHKGKRREVVLAAQNHRRNNGNPPPEPPTTELWEPTAGTDQDN